MLDSVDGLDGLIRRLCYRLSGHGWQIGEVRSLSLEELFQEGDLLLRLEHEAFTNRITAIEMGVGRAIMRAFGKKPSGIPTFDEIERKMLADQDDGGMAPPGWWEKNEPAE